MELKRHHHIGVKASFLKLLIVPYGIETLQAVQRTKFNNPFNRTLWD